MTAARRLILMRHAKSDWARSGLADHERTLNARGRRAAPLMGRWMEEERLAPDHALVSSAARAQETWALLGLDAPHEVLSALYNAEAETILSAAQGAPDAARTLLILGHLPVMQDAANAFLADRTIDAYPTAKLAVIDFDAERWSGLAFGAGRLVREMSPKALDA